MSGDPNDSCFNLAKWRAPESKEITSYLEDQATKRTVAIWANDGSISPLDLYCYLKARFGPPNGISMLFRKPSSDNGIQWHYTLFSSGSMIDFFGMNRLLEIRVSRASPVSDFDWRCFLGRIKEDFKTWASQMLEVRRSLEKWSLFINPFRRLDLMVDTLVKRLKALDLKEPRPPPLPPNSTQQRRYMEEFSNWNQNISEAQLLGTSLRMIAPVLAESFVNFLIFALAKQEIKSNARRYEDLIRKPLVNRVTSLHLYCEGFIREITNDSEAFKKFHSLMKARNDLLHGNVDPSKLKFDEVFFDGTIPLFCDEQSLAIRLRAHGIRSMEPEAALNDIKTVEEFARLLLDQLDPKYRQEILRLLKESQPGWREADKKIGILFSDTIVEFAGIKDGV
jgi:hypothetical protein